MRQGRRTQWILPLFGDRKPFQCAPVVGGNQYDGNFSPGGHWFAYFSDESGQPEVVPFPRAATPFEPKSFISNPIGRRCRLHGLQLCDYWRHPMDFKSEFLIVSKAVS